MLKKISILLFAFQCLFASEVDIKLTALDNQILQNNKNVDYCLLDADLKNILSEIKKNHGKELSSNMLDLCNLAEESQVNIVAAEPLLNLLNTFLHQNDKSLDDSLKINLNKYITHIANQLIQELGVEDTFRKKIKRFKVPIVSPAMVTNSMVANNITVNNKLTIDGVSLYDYVENIIDANTSPISGSGNVSIVGDPNGAINYFPKFANNNGIQIEQSNYQAGDNAINLIDLAGTNPIQVILTDTSNNNFALGQYNLTTVDASAEGSIAIGNSALNHVYAGSYCSSHNIALGKNALRNTSGNNNVALGLESLETNYGGDNSKNIAIGLKALNSNQADSLSNTAIGAHALMHNNGSFNVGMGDSAGYFMRNGSGNIYINNPGINTDSYTTRIGSETGYNSYNPYFINAQTSCYIAGINANAQENKLVTINNNGQLGVSTFSTSTNNNSAAQGVISINSNRTIITDQDSHNYSLGDNNFNTDAGTYNIALGSNALLSNNGDNSNYNIALGYNALQSNSGNNNIAIGQSALCNFQSGLQSNTMNKNIAIGYQAGYNLGNGDNNIYIASIGSSTFQDSESDTIRIGNSSNQKCFIAGINGITIGTTVLPVYIDSNGQLGTAPSSRRYKDNIKSLNKSAVNKLDLLRPVEFNYKVHDAQAIEYGLIAEEVLEDAGMRELVIFKDGNPESVKYHTLPILILARLQQLIKENNELKSDNSALKAKVDYILKHAYFKTEEVT